MDPLEHLIDDESRQVKTHMVIGSGASAVVIRKDDKAIKMAIVHTCDPEDHVENNRVQIRQEQRVYQRLQPDLTQSLPGIVPCLGLPGDTIELQFMSNGTLGGWINHRVVPSLSLQKQWIRQLAIGLSNIHANCVIHSDILLRNVLIDGSLNVMLSDFGASSVMPQDSVMTDTVDQYNCSMWTDIFQLGIVFYSIVTGALAGVSIYPRKGAHALLPPRDRLPSVTHLWAGQIIEDCWTPGAYGSAGAAGIIARLDRMDTVPSVCLPCRPLGHQ